MKIGVDMDEVIVDYIGGFLEDYNELNGADVKLEDILSYNLWENDFFGWGKEDTLEAVGEFNDSNGLGRLRLMDGVEEGLQKLAKGNEFYLITSRLEELRDRTEDYLSRKKLREMFSGIYFTSEFSDERVRKVDVGKRLGLDLMIDDNKRYAQEFVEEGIRCLLYDMPWNQSFEMEGVVRVYNWSDVVREVGVRWLGDLEGLEVDGS